MLPSQKKLPLSTTNQPLTIRNSTAEFLMFTADSHQDTIEVRFQDETVWLSQKMMALLFDVSIPTINEHLKNSIETDELDKNSVIRNFLITASDSKNYTTKHYNLDAIIAIHSSISYGAYFSKTFPSRKNLKI
jgi:hypothetical protein